MYKAFELHPLTAEIAGVRYNETDRAPFTGLAYDDVAAFYEHARTLDRAEPSRVQTAPRPCLSRVRFSPRANNCLAICGDRWRISFGWKGYRAKLGSV